MASTVENNAIVIGDYHSGTYTSTLANGASLVITLPRVARSARVYTPVAMRWVNASLLGLSLQVQLSVPTNAAAWTERVRQFVEIVLHNNSGGTIAANTISWDAELTEHPVSEYPSARTEANGFEGHAAAFTTGSGNTIHTETPS
ncbi:MAG: hypothetical protein ACPGVG_10260 [Mycobacterium sp.]